MRKFLCLLLILLMFMSVFSCCTPVYAEDYESYTLEPGKVYRFREVGATVKAEFSDYVLYSVSGGPNGYKDESKYYYNHYVDSISTALYLNVYNTSNKSVAMTMTEGTITEVDVFDSPFSLVMYDGTETEFKIINNIDDYVYCMRYEYDESDHSFDVSGEYLRTEGLRILTGKGFLFFKTNDRYRNTTFEGVHEISNYIRSGFFQVPPWILKKMMNLTELLGAFWNQLLTLLPVGLVILSVFLLVSLLIYTVRLFL